MKMWLVVADTYKKRTNTKIMEVSDLLGMPLHSTQHLKSVEIISDLCQRIRLGVSGLATDWCQR